MAFRWTVTLVACSILGATINSVTAASVRSRRRVSASVVDDNAARSGAALFPDVTYPQPVSTRYTYAGVPPVESWGVLPFADPVSTITALPGSSGSALVATTKGSLYRFTPPATSTTGGGGGPASSGERAASAAGGRSDALGSWTDVTTQFRPSGADEGVLIATGFDAATSSALVATAAPGSSAVTLCVSSGSPGAACATARASDTGASAIGNATAVVVGTLKTAAVTRAAAVGSSRIVVYVGGTLGAGYFQFDVTGPTSTPTVVANGAGQVPDVTLPVTALARDDARGVLAVGTGLTLHRIDEARAIFPVESMRVAHAEQNAAGAGAGAGAAMNGGGSFPPASRYFWVGGIIDNNVTALAYEPASGDLFIGNDDCVNVMRANWTFDRISYERGLPLGNVSSLAAAGPGVGAGDAVWIGHATGGLTLLGSMGLGAEEPQPPRKYFNGPRWIPGVPSVPSSLAASRVVAVAAIGASTAMVATADTGIAVIAIEQWTLERKAEALQAIVYPRHDRDGLISDVGLAEFGNTSAPVPRSSDNNGLWCALYLASQAFRYAATGLPEARTNALRAFDALEFLNKVTGIPGFMARSVIGPNETRPSEMSLWSKSPTYEGWIFKHGTSSDEVDGHLMAYPLFYAHVAETEEEKARALSLIDGITSHIVANNFTLVGVFGTPTRWGRWDPPYVNANPGNFDARGLQALQILTFLLSAKELTGDPKGTYAAAYNMLTQEQQYDSNVVNQKITIPNDDNFSDDELAFVPYLTLALQKHPEMQEVLPLSIRRAYDIVRRERPALWTMIYSIVDSSSADFPGALWTLRTFPISQVDWPIANFQREDVVLSRDLTRSNTKQIRSILPYDEIGIYRWNGNPFASIQGGSGTSECDPTAYLLPYWLARHLGVLGAPAS